MMFPSPDPSTLSLLFTGLVPSDASETFVLKRDLFICSVHLSISALLFLSIYLFSLTLVMGTCWVLSGVFPLLKYAFKLPLWQLQVTRLAWYSPSSDQYWAWVTAHSSLFSLRPIKLLRSPPSSHVPYPDIMYLLPRAHNETKDLSTTPLTSALCLECFVHWGPGVCLSFLLAMPLPFLFTSSLAFFWVIFITLLFLLLTWSHISIIFMVTLKITTWVCKLPMFHAGQDCPLLSNMSPESVLLTPWNYMLLGIC